MATIGRPQRETRNKAPTSTITAHSIRHTTANCQCRLSQRNVCFRRETTVEYFDQFVLRFKNELGKRHGTDPPQNARCERMRVEQPQWLQMLDARDRPAPVLLLLRPGSAQNRNGKQRTIIRTERGNCHFSTGVLIAIRWLCLDDRAIQSEMQPTQHLIN